MSYSCGACHYRSARWLGFCPRCSSESGLSEEGRSPAVATSLVELGEAQEPPRPTGLGEWDATIGGGLVPGAAVLVAGEPGVGKSTLLLQVAGAVAFGGGVVLIASGEESAKQVGMRARRLRLCDPSVHVLAAADTRDVLEAASALRPDVLIADSIQTLSSPEVDGTPGGVAQVRQAAAELIEYGKRHECAIVLVGHVTKEGAIAGPKVLEHLVDVVVTLDGDEQRGLRVLRCRKNRFGGVNGVGLLELTEDGLHGVEDPSRHLVGAWDGNVAGTVAFPAVEGARTFLVEVQALVTPTSLPQPRRSVRGVEVARVHQLLAVLLRHARLAFTGYDVYVAVSGGMRIREPAADLPIALALASSLVEMPLGRTAAWGELGLTGAVRAVGRDEWRREEAARLDVGRMLAPGDPARRIEEALSVAGVA